MFTTWSRKKILKIKLISIIFIVFVSGCAHLSTMVFPYPNGECPTDFPVKGNDSRYGWIYHTYESEYYDRVIAETCFQNEESAAKFGYRRFKVWKRYR
jgi:hypothetical protein